MPLPGRADDLLYAILWHPAQNLAGPLRRCHKPCRIPRAAGSNHCRHGVAGDAAGSLDHLKHGEALAVAKVADQTVVACTQIVYGLHVGIGKIHDVQIVAHAGSVLGR